MNGGWCLTRSILRVRNCCVIRRFRWLSLVNEYSASASEIVAGAVKDTRRGILVGQKTFGKGVVQKRYPLGPGDTIGAMSLTISTYYTPNGTSIHKEGITPHVPVSLEKYGRVEQTMQRMAMEKDAVENFVTKWIVDELKRTGETPKAFEKLEGRATGITAISRRRQHPRRNAMVKVARRTGVQPQCRH